MAVNNGDVIRAAARLSDANGKYLVNVFHFKLEGAGMTELACREAISGRLDDMYENLQSAFDDGVHFVDISYENVTQGTLMGIDAWPSLTAGGATGDGMPSQDTLVCSMQTLTPHVFGRKFLGTFIETGQAAGLWGSGLTSAAAAFIVDWLTPLSPGISATLLPGVARYIAGGTVDRFTHFVSGAVKNVVRGQRRRQNDRGS
jgi:hypothetical protein